MPNRGLPKKYAKMGFKKGWAAYKKTKRKSKAKRSYSAKPRKKARKRTYKKNKTTTRRRGNTGWNLRIGATAGALVPSLVDLWDGVQAGDPAGGMLEVVEGWTGYNADTGEISADKPMVYYGAMIAGLIASKIASKTGVNRYLPKGINI